MCNKFIFDNKKTDLTPNSFLHINKTFNILTTFHLQQFKNNKKKIFLHKAPVRRLYSYANKICYFFFLLSFI